MTTAGGTSHEVAEGLFRDPHDVLAGAEPPVEGGEDVHLDEAR